jgi:hypothetical protein
MAHHSHTACQRPDRNALKQMSIPNLILSYVVVLLAGLAGVGVYTELRKRRFEPTPSEDRIFRCRRCGYVYTDDSDVDRSRCTQCGQMNEAIRF